jgi:hypothetical protein
MGPGRGMLTELRYFWDLTAPTNAPPSLWCTLFKFHLTVTGHGTWWPTPQGFADFKLFWRVRGLLGALLYTWSQRSLSHDTPPPCTHFSHTWGPSLPHSRREHQACQTSAFSYINTQEWRLFPPFCSASQQRHSPVPNRRQEATL